jgi:hypothetical protein
MGKVIVAAALAVRVEGPRFIGQPSRGLAHGSAARGATCRLAAGGGGGGCMVMDGGDGMRGGGAGALARIPAAAQALYEAQLHGFGRGLGRLLANLHTHTGVTIRVLHFNPIVLRELAFY